MDFVRSYFCKGFQNEPAFMHVRMRDLKSWFVNYKIIVKQYVHVYHARTPSDRFRPSNFLFYSFQGTEQFQGRPVRLDFYRHINEHRLVLYAPRLSFVHGGLFSDGYPSAGQKPYRLQAVFFPVAEIGAYAYIHNCHGRSQIWKVHMEKIGHGERALQAIALN
jgi:hypothetical protein